MEPQNMLIDLRENLFPRVIESGTETEVAIGKRSEKFQKCAI